MCLCFLNTFCSGKLKAFATSVLAVRKRDGTWTNVNLPANSAFNAFIRAAKCQLGFSNWIIHALPSVSFLVSQKGPHTNKTSVCLCVLKLIDHAIQIHTYILYIVKYLSMYMYVCDILHIPNEVNVKNYPKIYIFTEVYLALGFTNIDSFNIHALFERFVLETS